MVNKDLKKKIKRLLNLSSMIVDKFEILASLSYHDHENSLQYEEHYNELKEYMNTEAVIVNNLSLEDLNQIFKELPKYDDNTDGYIRLHIYIDDKINELLLKNDEEDLENDISEEEELEVLEDDEEVEKYYIEEEENEKYSGIVMDNIAIIVLKKMYDRINNTIADNKGDNKYKRRLLKELKSFKYWVLSIDRHLECIGIDYKFDINKIPELGNPKIDTSSICHNDCVDLIERMYNNSKIDYEPTVISEVLFNFMCFEEFLKYIDDESVNKLIELCDELSINKDSYYGNIVKEKLVKKRQN